MDFEARRQKLRKILVSTGAEAILVTHAPNVTYLTGFTGEDSYLLLTEKSRILITDGRFVSQLADECPDLDLNVRRPGISIHQAVVRVVRSFGISRLAVEGESMTVSLYSQIAEKLSTTEIRAVTGLVEQLREIKDKEEIALIREAITCAEKAFAVIRATLRPELTEKQVADDLETQCRRFGASGSAFPPIVAVNERAALPHATPTEKPLGDGGFVLIDWGAVRKLYRSDLTRVLVTGKILPKLRRVYGVVLSASARAIDAIRPGVACNEVDAAARGFIAEAGFGSRFNHGLGHGIGLEIHESPRLSAKNTTILKPGMVITVEPGVYLPGWGGVRIEDDVLVTRTGREVLTSTAKQLEEMVL